MWWGSTGSPVLYLADRNLMMFTDGDMIVFALVGSVFLAAVIAGFVGSIWAIVDINRWREDQWRAANKSKTTWLLVVIGLFFFISPLAAWLSYLLGARRALKRAAEAKGFDAAMPAEPVGFPPVGIPQAWVTQPDPQGTDEATWQGPTTGPRSPGAHR